MTSPRPPQSARRAKRSARRRGFVAGVLVLTVALGLGTGLSVLGAFGETHAPAESPGPSEQVRSSASASAAPTAPSSPSANPEPAYDIDDPNSIHVVVNKRRPISPLDFAPADLRAVNVPHTWSPVLRDEAASAVEAMFAAASAEAGLALASNSAYRSFSAQQRIYDGNDLLKARPGYSEHQTGLAIDIGAVSGVCSLNACFATTPEGQWLAANAARFGFVLRYPDGKTSVTGYSFEPWHFRYVGVEVASAMAARGVSTLEEFFGLPPAPTY